MKQGGQALEAMRLRVTFNAALTIAKVKNALEHAMARELHRDSAYCVQDSNEPHTSDRKDEISK